jgi:hypothetical protein
MRRDSGIAESGDARCDPSQSITYVGATTVEQVYDYLPLASDEALA